MNQQDQSGTIQTLLDRLNKERIPHAIALKDKVDKGELLDEFDLEFLEEALDSATVIAKIDENHPEYQDIAGKMIELYHHITNQGLENTLKVLVEGLSKQHIPQALSLKAKVDAGEALSEADYALLEDAFDTASRIKEMAESSLKHEAVTSQVAELHDHITRKADKNNAQ